MNNSSLVSVAGALLRCAFSVWFVHEATRHGLRVVSAGVLLSYALLSLQIGDATWRQIPMEDFLWKLRKEKHRKSTPNQEVDATQEWLAIDEVARKEKIQLGITAVGSILILLYALFVLATS